MKFHARVEGISAIEDQKCRIFRKFDIPKYGDFGGLFD